MSTGFSELVPAFSSSAHRANPQKFKELQSRLFNSHGFRQLGSLYSSTSAGSNLSSKASSSSANFHTNSLLSRPCLSILVSSNHLKGNYAWVRDNLASTPFFYSQYGTLMRLPRNDRSPARDTPEHDPSVRISTQQPTITSTKLESMDLARMSTQDVDGFRRWLLRRTRHGWFRPEMVEQSLECG